MVNIDEAMKQRMMGLSAEAEGQSDRSLMLKME